MLFPTKIPPKEYSFRVSEESKLKVEIKALPLVVWYGSRVTENPLPNCQDGLSNCQC